ncbi:MAG: hypothetical protein MJ211_10865 [Bacteroidales bacterium]|nr:hypothetical protein [Bacteroidales bacterium]
MQKIIIIGCPGSGKSFLSKKLNLLTNIPLYHLDNIWWNKNGNHISREEFDKKLLKILNLKSWIIDGDYSRTYEIRIKYCDTIIFLDFSENQCIKGISERINQQRDDCPINQIDSQLINIIKKYNKENKPKIFELLKKYTEKKILIFKERSETEKWIEIISNQQR